MPTNLPIDAPTERLRQLMTAAAIPSFRALAQRAGVSDWAVKQLRRDRLHQMRVETLHKLATALQVSLPALLEHFGVIDGEVKGFDTRASDRITALETEYQRLQTQLEQQETLLQQRWQREALTILESWLVQWPTIVHAVTKKPDLPASRLVPLVQPVQTLLEEWRVEAIATVGAEVPYDPQRHQLMDGIAATGDLVKVRYAGFHHGEMLLHRAKVSPVSASQA
ncbi:MAG: helix-turn-helix transcriptional regulator [Cyanobacteria bacterium P01_H01_bin.162]